MSDDHADLFPESEAPPTIEKKPRRKRLSIHALEYAKQTLASYHDGEIRLLTEQLDDAMTKIAEAYVQTHWSPKEPE
jgi:hypothetical protein